MMKKEYMTPELEEIDLEFEGALMDLSTDDSMNDNDDIEDI